MNTANGPDFANIGEAKEWVRTNTDNTMFETTAAVVRVSASGYVWVLATIYIRQDTGTDDLMRCVWERAISVA